MKYRIHQWVNTKNKELAFGIQVQEKKGQKFKHCISEVNGVNRALIYKEELTAAFVCDGLNGGFETILSVGLVELK